MNSRYILCSILILAALSGCTGGGETKTTTTTAAPTTTTTTTAPTTTTTTAAPTTAAAPTTTTTTAPTVEVVLHGTGSCDVCHEAPAMDEWKGVLMKTAFEKNPAHKDMCSNCHTVETFCAKEECHPLPSVMTPAPTEEPPLEDEGS